MVGKIYCYTNKYNNHKYIGQTTLSTKKRAGKDGRYYVYKLATKFSLAIQKYGWDAFVYEILEEIEADTYQELKQKLNEKEIYYIKYFDTYKNGYNSTPGGACGKPCSEATRKKLSLALRGYKYSEERNRRVKEGLIKLYDNRDVVQYGQNFEIIKIWPTISSILLAANTPVKSVNALRKACRGKQHGSHHYAGYYWWYFDAVKGFANQCPTCEDSVKVVYCKELNKQFKTIAEAGRELKQIYPELSECYCAKRIELCLQGKVESLRDYHFSYETVIIKRWIK